MRNVTIKRAKSFVGCAMKVQVYIQDESAEELVIEGVSCRKLGTLKNGEEKAFTIGDGQARIFVIADKLSKGYCSESVIIPAGQEDVALSGKNHFNPLAGNPFCFDGKVSAEVMQKRKKNGRKSLLLFCALVILGCLVGQIVGGLMVRSSIGNAAVEPKTFTAEGMRITLTNEFSKISQEDFTACYSSENVAVMALREGFELAEGLENYTLEEYGNLVIKSNGLDTLQLQNNDGLTCFEYQWTNPDDNNTFHYFSVVYKAEDAFWLIQFSSLAESAEQYLPSFVEWASSVQFGDY